MPEPGIIGHREVAIKALYEAQPSKEFTYGLDFERKVNGLVDFFETAKPAQSQKTPARLTSQAGEPIARRCSCMYSDTYDKNRHHITLENITRKIQKSTDITSLFIRRSDWDDTVNETEEGSEGLGLDEQYNQLAQARVSTSEDQGMRDEGSHSEGRRDESTQALASVPEDQEMRDIATSVDTQRRRAEEQRPASTGSALTTFAPGPSDILRQNALQSSQRMHVLIRENGRTLGGLPGRRGNRSGRSWGRSRPKRSREVAAPRHPNKRPLPGGTDRRRLAFAATVAPAALALLLEDLVDELQLVLLGVLGELGLVVDREHGYGPELEHPLAHFLIDCLLDADFWGLPAPVEGVDLDGRDPEDGSHPQTTKVAIALPRNGGFVP
ncbi:hypothetical protein F4779DRAFT_620385 [Xylariaceae sp. FL0662B]|nr:hypothetical protein F4779DRAFT_620385 [Xylariaceae sp. FL0662B]